MATIPRRKWLLGAAASLLAAKAPAARPGGLTAVARFDAGVRLEHGGSANPFGPANGDVLVVQTARERRGAGGRSLEIGWDAPRGKACGAYLTLFDETEDRPGEALDISGARYLSFWIKGSRGGEDFTVRMAGPRLFAREDSVAAGKVSRFLESGVQKDWREVLIPLEEFQLGEPRAAAIAFEFRGSGKVWIDDVYLKVSSRSVTPESAAEPPTPRPVYSRAVWVWRSGDLLASETAQRSLLARLGAAGIGRIFLQALFAGSALQGEPELRAFLRKCSAQGIRVDALDGDPEYALAENHPRTLALTGAVVDFNLRSDPPERFHGLHLDNEPYLLLGFESPERARILQEYLDLNFNVRARLRTPETGLTFAIDAPFWFDSALPPLEWRGASAKVMEHLLTVADESCVMAYRRSAGGRDGIVRHVSEEAKAASKLGRTLWAGVETGRLDAVEVRFAAAVHEEAWQADPAIRPLLRMARFEGFPLHALQRGSWRFLGLRTSRGRSGEEQASALARLVTAAGVRPLSPELVDEAARAARREGWQEVGPWRAPGRPNLLVLNGRPPAERKTTFWGTNPAFLEDVIQEAAEELSRYSAFEGVALHDADSYFALEDRR